MADVPFQQFSPSLFPTYTRFYLSLSLYSLPSSHFYCLPLPSYIIAIPVCSFLTCTPPVSPSLTSIVRCLFRNTIFLTYCA